MDEKIQQMIQQGIDMMVMRAKTEIIKAEREESERQAAWNEKQREFEQLLPIDLHKYIEPLWKTYSGFMDLCPDFILRIPECAPIKVITNMIDMSPRISGYLVGHWEMGDYDWYYRFNRFDKEPLLYVALAQAQLEYRKEMEWRENSQAIEKDPPKKVKGLPEQIAEAAALLLGLLENYRTQQEES